MARDPADSPAASYASRTESRANVLPVPAGPTIVFTAAEGEGPGLWGAVNIMGSDAAENLFHNLFFNAERYDLSRVGRYKLNRKLGDEVAQLGALFGLEGAVNAEGEPLLDLPDENQNVLSRCEVLAAITYMLHLVKQENLLVSVDLHLDLTFLLHSVDLFISQGLNRLVDQPHIGPVLGSQNLEVRLDLLDQYAGRIIQKLHFLDIDLRGDQVRNGFNVVAILLIVYAVGRAISRHSQRRALLSARRLSESLATARTLRPSGSTVRSAISL